MHLDWTVFIQSAFGKSMSKHLLGIWKYETRNSVENSKMVIQLWKLFIGLWCTPYMQMAFLIKKAQIQQSNVHKKPGMKCYRDITLPKKVRLVKAMDFPVVMYGCESWTVKKAEHQRIDAFELWC